MSTKQRVEKLAAELGVTIEYGTDELMAESPAGSIFRGTETHGVVASKWDDETMEDCWKGLLRDLRDGLTACNIVDCDICGGVTA